MNSNTISNGARTILAKYNTVRLVGTVDQIGICESGKTLCLKNVKVYSLDGMYSHDVCVGELDHIWVKGVAINKNTIQSGIVTVIGHTSMYHKRSGLIQFGIKTVCLYKGGEYKQHETTKNKSKAKNKRKHG